MCVGGCITMNSFWCLQFQSTYMNLFFKKVFGMSSCFSTEIYKEENNHYWKDSCLSTQMTYNSINTMTYRHDQICSQFHVLPYREKFNTYIRMYVYRYMRVCICSLLVLRIWHSRKKCCGYYLLLFYYYHFGDSVHPGGPSIYCMALHYSF